MTKPQTLDRFPVRSMLKGRSRLEPLPKKARLNFRGAAVLLGQHCAVQRSVVSWGSGSELYCVLQPFYAPVCCSCVSMLWPVLRRKLHSCASVRSPALVLPKRAEAAMICVLQCFSRFHTRAHGRPLARALGPRHQTYESPAFLRLVWCPEMLEPAVSGARFNSLFTTSPRGLQKHKICEKSTGVLDVFCTPAHGRPLARALGGGLQVAEKALT